jgi:hypothetical protein
VERERKKGGIIREVSREKNTGEETGKGAGRRATW